MSSINSYLSSVFVNKAQSVAGTWVNVGTVQGTGDFATIGINITNTSTSNNVTFNLALSYQSSPNLQDMIEYNLVLNPGGVLSRSKIIAGIGENLFIQASTGDLACRLYGVTQSTFNEGTVSTINGTSSGTVQYVLNQLGASKMIVMSFINYVNDSATPQTIQLPISFQNTPLINNEIMDLNIEASGNQITIGAPNNTVAYNGTVFISGI